MNRIDYSTEELDTDLSDIGGVIDKARDAAGYDGFSGKQLDHVDVDKQQLLMHQMLDLTHNLVDLSVCLAACVYGTDGMSPDGVEDSGRQVCDCDCDNKNHKVCNCEYKSNDDGETYYEKNLGDVDKASEFLAKNINCLSCPLGIECDEYPDASCYDFIYEKLNEKVGGAD